MALKRSLVLVWFVVLAGCSSTGQAGVSTPSSATSTPQVTWMINQAALTSLQTTSTGWSRTESERFFDNAHTYVIGQLPSGWQSRWTRSFPSYVSIQAAFTANAIPSAVQAIVYDAEAWQFTPLAEQQHFATSVQEAAALVHRHHMVLIATPATDLVRVLDPNGAGDTYSRFLSLNIIQSAAHYADAVEIQAQGAEANAPLYAQFVHAASAQAKAANPAVVVLAGLSTNPDGEIVTGEQLYAAFQATRSEVSGYWLNIPGQNEYCPACGSPQPQVAVAFLKRLLLRGRPMSWVRDEAG